MTHRCRECDEVLEELYHGCWKCKGCGCYYFEDRDGNLIAPKHTDSYGVGTK